MGVGRWTTLEEWQNIDLLALDAWRTAEVIGYEVKVSRSDMRQELLNPSKRVAAVSMCTRFYFAVPAGLLKPEEREYEEPDWEPGDFERTSCTGIPEFGPRRYRTYENLKYGGQCQKIRGRKESRRYYDPRSKTVPTGHLIEVPAPVTLTDSDETHWSSNNSDRMLEQRISIELADKGVQWVKCPACAGKGHSELSRVEREAPTLWVPKDVGLVVVGPGGCSVLKEAPKNKTPEPILPYPFMGGVHEKLTPEASSRINRQHISQLVRWTSARPDPRHR